MWGLASSSRKPSILPEMGSFNSFLMKSISFWPLPTTSSIR